MSQPQTERIDDSRTPVDALPASDALEQMRQGHAAAIDAVSSAIAEIARAADAVAHCLSHDGTLCYVAAGSSGLIALADAAEIPGTFGVSPDRIRLCMAGGVPNGAFMPGDTEDGVKDARDAAGLLGDGDVLITLSASGTTAFACAGAEVAKARGATVIAVANNPGTPLLSLADIPILLPTPPEVVAGSTRLGAGTAQKAALNMISTMVGIHLGHVHDAMMVNVRADNSKLRARAAGMVARIADVPMTEAEAALQNADGSVKCAVLMTRGMAPDTAIAALAENNQNLRKSLAAIGAGAEHQTSTEGD